METKSLFLKWALFACLVVIGAAIVSSLGWAGYVLNGDETHLTLVNLVVLALTTAWCGRLSWRLSNGAAPKEIKHALESGWFASSVCVTLGLLGTVVGYYMMLQSGPGGGEDAGEQLVRQIRASMGTALINTVVGGFCGLIIELQSHFIGQAAKKAMLDDGEDGDS